MQNAAIRQAENNPAEIISFNNWVSKDVEQKQTAPQKVKAPILDAEYLGANVKPSTPVEPLSEHDVVLLRNYFFNNNDYFRSMPTNRRNYLYIVLSLNLMRRGGDMVKLRVSDVLNEDGSFKEHVIFSREEKTGKRAVVYLNSKCREALVEYFGFIGEYKMSDWLFPNYKTAGEHMTVDGMRKMLQRTCAKLGIETHVGTHSLRKTIPHLAITNSTSTEDEATVSQLLNHSNIRTTYHYIGRNQRELDDFVERNAL